MNERIKIRRADVKAQAVRHWKCANGHVLGFVERRRMNGRHVTVLLELRQAIDLGADQMIEPRISGVLEGGKTIICSACEARGERVARYFSPTDAMLQIYLDRLGFSNNGGGK